MTTTSSGRVAALRRFPVKGLSAEELERAELAPGLQIAGDRAFAIENGPSGFDPDAPAKLPKVKFLCLMRNARLASLRTSYDPSTWRLEIESDGRLAAAVDLRSPEGRRSVEEWLTGFMGEEARGTLKVLPAPGRHTFSDTAKGWVSIVNRASVAAIEDFCGAPVDPLRFRANIDIAGLEPWEELDWVGRTIVIGGATLKVTRRTVRCAATEVDPVSAQRDLPIPATLMKRLGHADCGVYAEAVSAGAVAVGDEIRLVS